MMKVLVAEDDPVALEVVRSILEEHGCDVASASNGRQALEMLRSLEDISLVISDWDMPEMTGPELCQAIRKENLPRYVYVILLTARQGTSHLVDGLKAGADEFISKPLSPEELVVRLRTAERILALETRDLTIFALAKLAESRDPETGQHLERVRYYARSLASEMATQPKFKNVLTQSVVTLIYQTSPLHDIGKVGIPDSVLLKPDRLDDIEFEIMKTHARAGAETLDKALRMHPSAAFLRMARDIAASHHERFDGQGYPDGLAGEQIPLAARIFALADVYDALVSKRVYKPGFTHDVAKKIIRDGRGTQFDPDVVDAFLRCEPQFRASNPM
ncbi:MAG: response regulator [Phycisphaerales bacterium]|nr:response regulator [Phycisphaerales bacterium]